MKIPETPIAGGNQARRQLILFMENARSRMLDKLQARANTKES